MDGEIRLRDPKDAFEGGNDILKKTIYDLVGYAIQKDADRVERWSQTHFLDWSHVISNESHMVECGLSGVSFEHISPRIPLPIS